MLHVNDDNNDELFRRAAEHYPVKTDSADWETLRAKMDAAPAEDDQPVVVARRKNYRFLWLLLLLIPLGILENKYEIIGKHGIGGKKEIPSVATETKTNTQSTQTETNEPGKSPVTAVTEPTAVSQMQTSNSDQENISTINNDTKRPVQIDKKSVNSNSVNTDDDLKVKGKNARHANQRSRMKIKTALATAAENEKKRSIVKSDSQKQKLIMKTATAEGDEGVVDKVKTVDKVEGVNKVDKENDGAVKDDRKKDEEKIIDKKDTTAVKKIEKEIAKTETKTGKKESKKDKGSKKHFYVGLIAGPDFSTIKLQSVKKTGLNFGFIAGYKINKKFSVETGILKDKKFYSSKGQYFSTKNIYLPPNATIEYVDGECNMLEWPVNFTYRFRQRARSGLFATAGVSSYFMKDEAYVYDISHNGYRYPYSYKYKNHSTALLAAINISAGYTLKLGKIADLRIEPFIKLPVNKIGTGKLPIQSGGVMVGLTKTIF